jgi:hypothetical protein
MLNNILPSFEKGPVEIAPSALEKGMLRLDVIAQARQAVDRAFERAYPDMVPLSETEKVHQPFIDKAFKTIVSGFDSSEPDVIPADNRVDDMMNRQLAIEQASQNVASSYDQEATFSNVPTATTQPLITDDHPNQSAIDEAYLAVLAAQETLNPEIPEELSA